MAEINGRKEKQARYRREAEELSARNRRYIETGPLEKEYKNAQSSKHSEYVQRIIKDGLDSERINKKNRISMFRNYEHLIDYVHNIGEGEDVLESIRNYFRNTKADESEDLRYPFAKKNLTPINAEGEYSEKGLGRHLQEVTDYAEKVLFNSKTGERHFEGFFNSDSNKDLHYAALLVDVVTPLHDILKFLGNPDAQVMPDHEIMTAALIRNVFGGKTVILRGEEYILNDDDVEFIAGVVEDHENIGDDKYLREEGRDSYIKSEDPIQKAKALFFLIDTQTGVFEFSDDGSDKITINEDRLQERFSDLYFRHVAKFSYDDESKQSIKTAKIFRPIWGAYAIHDYISLFREIEETGLRLPENWQTILVSKALLVLEEAENEHYQLIEHELSTDPETGERYSFNPDDIKEIQRTKRQLVFKMLKSFIEKSGESDEIPSIEGLMIFIEGLDREYQSGEVIIKNRGELADYLNNLLEKVGFFDPSIVNGVNGEQQAKELREKLVGKIMAHPSLFMLDDLMHNKEFLAGAAEISHRGYASRHNEATLSEVEKAASIAGLMATQELLGVFSERQKIPLEKVITNILEGNIDQSQFITMITVQKMHYLFSREFNGQVFTREPSFLGDSSIDDKKEDWAQIKDNVRYLADKLGLEHKEKDPEELDIFLNMEFSSASARLNGRLMEELFKTLLQSEEQMVDQAILADQRYKEGVIEEMGDVELAKTILRILDGNEYNWLFDENYINSIDRSDLERVVANGVWIGDYPPTTKLFDNKEQVMEIIEKIKRIAQAKNNKENGVELEEITDKEREVLELRAVNMVDIYTVMTTMFVYQNAYGENAEDVLTILNEEEKADDDQSKDIFDFSKRMAHSFWYSSLFQRMRDRSLTRVAMPYDMLTESEKDKDGVQVSTGAEVILDILLEETSF